MRKSSFFWVSYADLMTSLFFVMLVLFVVTVRYVNHLREISEAKLNEIENIETALKNLDQKYFSFDENSSRYFLNIDVNFPSNKVDINTISKDSRKKLVDAGERLHEKMDLLIKGNPEVSYLLIVEGNTQRNKSNYKLFPDIGYRYSYMRALSLANFWKENGINFYDLAPNCEILVVGSGYFGQSRVEDEELNRRFTVQVTSKLGKLLGK